VCQRTFSENPISRKPERTDHGSSPVVAPPRTRCHKIARMAILPSPRGPVACDRWPGGLLKHRRSGLKPADSTGDRIAQRLSATLI
jgi:hypothetical protein